MKTTAIFSITISILFIWILTSCSPEVERYPPITEDFCAQIEPYSPGKLADHLVFFSDSMETKTGVYTLEEGDKSMVFRAWLTDAAEKTIDIQYFIFSADNIGLIAIDYLLRAADRGVRVRLLVDDIMVEADAGDLVTLDAHPNLSIKIYNPNANVGKNLPKKLYSLTSNFQGFNQRMHNKTFIVDGQVVITGGRNIADEYFDYDHAYNFRDRDVLLIGKTAVDIQHSFEQFWASDLSIPISTISQQRDDDTTIAAKYNYVHQYACSPDNFWPEVREEIKSVPIAFRQINQSGALVWVDSVVFVSDDPGKNESKEMKGGGKSTDYLISLIRSAKKSVHIQSPYFITTELGQQLFAEAIQRGVEVKILTNSMSSTDNLEAFSGYQRDRKKLLDIGVDVYEFKPDAAIRFEVMTGALQRTIDYVPIFGLHAKSMVVDEEIAVIGTFNLDPRSANLNTECIAVIHDTKIAGDLFAAMEVDMKPENAWHTTTTFNPDTEAGLWKRFKVWTRRLVPKSVL